MKQELKTALRVAGLYLLAVILASAAVAGLGHALSTAPLGRILHPLYYVIVAIGALLAFVAGWTYHPALDRNMTRLRREFEGHDESYLRDLCRMALLARYYGYGALIYLAASACLSPLWDSYPEIECLLWASGFCCLYVWMMCRKKLRELRLDSFRRRCDALK